MLIKLDEDLPNATTILLRERGHDAAGVRDQRMGGWDDTRLWNAVQPEGRLLITADKGFADVRTHPPGTHAGVLLLRPDDDGIAPLIALLESVLESCQLEALKGTVTVATTKGIRIRR